jgi:hypothetical protein
LRDEKLAAMLEPQGGLEVRGAEMRLAFFLDRLGGRRVAGPDGGRPGFVSSLLVAPDEGLGVVCFTNTSDALATRGRPTWTSVRVWGGAALLGAAAATATGVRRGVHRRST